jgi:hypothetical protein
MKLPACVSFKARLFCIRTAQGNEKVWRFTQPHFACNPRHIHPQWGNGGAGIRKGFAWTQKNPHFLSPTKWKISVQYWYFRVHPMIQKQILRDDTLTCKRRGTIYQSMRGHITEDDSVSYHLLLFLPIGVHEYEIQEITSTRCSS